MLLFAALHESAFGPKRTSLVAPHMSAFGGKADIAQISHRSAMAQSRHPCHGAKAGICLGLSIIVNRPGATCSDAVEADSR
jgi:hypothetical protein